MQFERKRKEKRAINNVVWCVSFAFFRDFDLLWVCSGCRWLLFWGHNNFKRSVQNNNKWINIEIIYIEWRCKCPSTQNKTDLLQKKWERQTFSSWCCGFFVCQFLVRLTITFSLIVLYHFWEKEERNIPAQCRCESDVQKNNKIWSAPSFACSSM